MKLIIKKTVISEISSGVVVIQIHSCCLLEFRSGTIERAKGCFSYKCHTVKNNRNIDSTQAEPFYASTWRSEENLL